MPRDTYLRTWSRSWSALLCVVLVFGSFIGLSSIEAPSAGAEVIPEHPDCIPGPNPGTFVVPPGYPPGTQCLSPNSGGASLSPRLSTLGWGGAVTFTYAADNVGDPNNPNWGVGWSLPNDPQITVEAGCTGRSLTCTLRYRPGGSWGGLRSTYWNDFGAFSGGGRGAFASAWVTPSMYQVDVRARRPDGTDLTGATTTGGVAVRPGQNPNLADCLFLAFEDYYVPGTTPGLDHVWWPTDGDPSCVRARSLNANNPTVYPTWAYGLPAGEWDLYQWDEAGPPDPAGAVRQATPYSVERVTVGDADQTAYTTLQRRPRPQVSVQVLGAQPVALGQTRTVRLTIDAGPADTGYADVSLQPADLGLTVSDPAVVEIVSGPDPAPVPGGFQMFAGQQRQFTYEVRAVGEGTVGLTGAIRSETDQGIVTTDQATANVTALVVREMQLRNLSVTPDTLADGDPFTVNAELVNVGNVDVNGVTVTGAVDTSVPGNADLASPSPSTVASVPVGGSTWISIPGTLRDTRGATVRVEASGAAADTGATVSASERIRAGRAPLALAVRVQAPGVVVVNRDGNGDVIPEDVDVIVKVGNTGSDDLDSAQLLGDPRFDLVDETLASPFELVDPAPDRFLGTLAPGEERDLTFHYRAVSVGTVDAVAEAWASGVDGDVQEQASARIRVTDQTDLSVDATGVPDKAEVGESVIARVTVRNPSATEVVSGVELAPPTFTGPNAEIVEAPAGNDVGFDLQPGEQRTVRWKLKWAESGASRAGFAATGTRGTDEVAGRGDRDVAVRERSELRWWMEPRYTGHGTETTDYEGAHPDAWPIHLALPVAGGCADVELELFDVAGGGEAPITGSEVVDAAACEWRFPLSELAPLDLMARIRRDGDVVAEVTEKLEPRDIVVVSIGDSMSSGEGARDLSRDWTFAQCDRSANAGPAQAAARLEDDGDPDTLEDAHSSVTFVHLACSGASTRFGLLGQFPGTGTQASLGPTLAPQLISALPAIVADRDVDVLLMTAGINDIKFEEFLSHCLDNDSCASVPFHGQDVAQVIGQRIDALDAMYDDLDTWIRTVGVKSENVYLLEYPDPSKDDAGEYCDYYFPNSTTPLKHLDPTEWEFLETTMQVPLNAAGAAGAARNGWHRVGNVMSAFRNHGICADQYWSNSIGTSLLTQDTVYGSFHPNTSGHGVFGGLIFDTLLDAGAGSTATGGGGSGAAQLTGPNSAGTQEVALTDHDFVPGDIVTINPGAANQETRRIDALGSLIFDHPLYLDHGAGEIILRTTAVPAEAGANQPPIAVDDAVTVAPSGPTVIPIADLLANDVDPEGGSLSIYALGGNYFTADGTSVIWDRPGVSCEPASFSYAIVDEGGASGAADGVVTVTPDCSALSTPSISVGDASIVEGDRGTRSLRLAVTLSEPGSSTVTVRYQIATVTATAGAASTPGADVNDSGGRVKTLTFKKPVTTKPTPVVKYVNVPVYPDSEAEEDESFVVTLSDPTGGYLLADAVGTGTILDDDPAAAAGAVASVGDATIHEGNDGRRTLTFRVTLSEPVAADGSVDWSIVPVSATGNYKSGANPPAGTDVADRLGAVKRLAFKPGAVQKSVSVVVYPDQLAEGDETFEIRLTNPAGGVSLGRAVAIGAIVDDEPPGA